MKKRTGRGLAACLLILTMAVLLCACGAKKKNISGTYNAIYNMREELNQELEEAGMTVESDINAGFVLQLNEDETFVCDIDGEGVKTSLAEALSSDGSNMIKTMLESEGITEDMYETIALASGYDSFDAFVEAMVQTIVTEMGEGFETELETAIHYEGTYSVEDNVLTLTGEAQDGRGMEQGTINEDGTISVTMIMDDGTALDLVFTKQP